MRRFAGLCACSCVNDIAESGRTAAHSDELVWRERDRVRRKEFIVASTIRMAHSPGRLAFGGEFRYYSVGIFQGGELHNGKRNTARGARQQDRGASSAETSVLS